MKLLKGQENKSVNTGTGSSGSNGGNRNTGSGSSSTKGENSSTGSGSSGPKGGNSNTGSSGSNGGNSNTSVSNTIINNSTNSNIKALQSNTPDTTKSSNSSSSTYQKAKVIPKPGDTNFVGPLENSISNKNTTTKGTGNVDSTKLVYNEAFKMYEPAELTKAYTYWDLIGDRLIMNLGLPIIDKKIAESGVTPNGRVLTQVEKDALYEKDKQNWIDTILFLAFAGGKAKGDVVPREILPISEKIPSTLTKEEIVAANAMDLRMQAQRGIGGKGWRGDSTWRANVGEIGSGGTVEKVNGTVPTQHEAIDLITASGGKVIRIEDAHPEGGMSNHTYPHINYTTPSGTKGTIQIQEVIK